MDDGEQGFDKSFGQRLRELRTARGWSQGYLAQRMTNAGTAIHQTQIAKLEAGARAVRLSEAVALARTLGASLEALVPQPTSTGKRVDQRSSETPEHVEYMMEIEELDRDIARTEEALRMREAELARARRQVEEELAEVVADRHALRGLQARSAALQARLTQQLHEHKESRSDAIEEEGQS